MVFAVMQAGSSSGSSAIARSGCCSSSAAQSSSTGSRNPGVLRFEASTNFFGNAESLRIKTSIPKQRRTLDARAQSKNSSVVGPWEPESPIGQLLVSLLQTHPHLFSAAAEQQIQALAADKKAAASQADSNSSGSELVLYKRIAEVREQERHKAIVEVIYSMVVEKFLEAGLSLAPKIPILPANRKVDDWTFVEKDMESIHSAEVLEVVRDHLGMILGRPSSHFQESQTLVQASKMKIGHLYAATVVFGYFLRRLDQRYQLERKALGRDENSTEDDDKKSEENRPGISEELDFKTDSEGQKLAAEANAAVAAMAAAKSGRGAGIFPQMGWKPSKLKSYVMLLDQENLARLATLRCKESLEVVERQTQALFGKPEAEIAPDGSVVLMAGDSFTISLAGLRRLVLEAVAFGSFLWDAETHVDSHYNLVG